MIAFIEGQIESVGEHMVVIVANHIGYQVQIPTSTLAAIGEVGKTTRLYTHLQVREDGLGLFGFHSLAQKELFLLLTSVSSVGPKSALQMLSALPVETLLSAIATSDIALLATCPGIGKKTAERIVVELRSKVPALAAPVTGIPTPSPQQQDAIDALVKLGFKEGDVRREISALLRDLGPEIDSSELIRQALGRLR